MVCIPGVGEPSFQSIMVYFTETHLCYIGVLDAIGFDLSVKYSNSIGILHAMLQRN